MKGQSKKNISFLDKLRLEHGNDYLKSTFLEVGKQQKEKAGYLMNDKRLSFSCLFILLPEINSLNLYDVLNTRNNTAIKICGKAIKDTRLASQVEGLAIKSHEDTYQVLKWILETGAKDDGFDDDFDEVLDVTSAILIKKYNDKTTLPIVVDMVFKRNRKGYLIHDLVWALFQSHDPEVLKLIARYLRSTDKKDRELAYKLLNAENISDDIKNLDNRNLYQAYLLWFKENYPYLYFTDESFQLTSTPTPCRVDLENKYLCKPISPYKRKPLPKVTELERKHLEYFKELDYSEKVLLSKISNEMHNRNIRLWKKWIQSPVTQQIEYAKNSIGGEIK